MSGFIIENLDYLLFVVLAIAGLISLGRRVRRSGQRMPRRIYVIYAAVVLLGLPLATMAGKRPEQNIKRILLNVAPLAALQMHLGGHESVRQNTPDEDPTYRRLLTIQRQFVGSTPNIHDVFTATTTADGEVVYLVHAASGAGGAMPADRIGARRGRSADLIRSALERNEVVVASPRSVLDGERSITAVAPIGGAAGRPYAVAGVEFDGSLWIKARRMYRVAVLLLLGVMAALLAHAGYSLAVVGAQLASVREAESRSREAEERLRRIVNTSEDAIVLTDADSRVSAWNHRAAEIFGWSGREAEGRPLASALQPATDAAEYAARLSGFLGSLTADAPPSRLEFRGRRADGSPLIGKISAAALTLNGQRSYAVFLRDETARVRADEELRELADQLERTQEFGRMGSFEIDLATDRMSGSVQALDILGFAVVDEATTDTLIAKLHPEDRVDALDALRAARRVGIDFLVQARLADGRGGFRHVRLRARPRHDALGRPAVLSGTVSDVTDLAEASVAARVGRRQFEDLFESASAALFVTGPDGATQLANLAAQQLLGRSREQLIGRSLEDLLRTAGLLPRGARSLSDCANAQRQALHRDTPSRNPFFGEVLVREFDTATGRGLVVQIDDTTERETRLRHDLREQRMASIGTLAAGIAHDLNNALAPIPVSAEVIRRRAPEVTKTVDAIEQSALRASRMVNQLLLFVRGAEAGERREVLPQALVGEMMKIIDGSFPKNIKLEADFEETAPVRGDPTQLHQVVLNLAINARDALPEGGRIRFGTKQVELSAEAAAGMVGARPGRFAVVTVRDSGVGIAPDNLERVFDPFFTTKPPGQGTGLGLATVLGVVRGHDGFVSVSSKPGEGTEFRLYLPVIAGAAAGGGESVPSQHQRHVDGAGALVLVVDDEEPLREAVSTLLSGAYYRTEFAADGAEALTRFLAKRREIRVILTDLQMPGLDGLWLVQAIRKVSKDVRLVVATGVLVPDQQKALKDAGADAIVLKPFAARALLEAVAGGPPPSSPVS